ncbi:MAG TPA: YgeY family selenium metabolism-linked hydrolase [bacterium]|nr:YgeY family selenium metabolism-linked hydrolase [Myxococcales bacterium]OQA60337.1 MAG: putative succinyl-diaminopimelate desuccinylase [bacterium ADurb.Bin270]HPW45293.1 YgeY family selenium metabolism-linked hydrolase [bacterium]HQC50625.1 YgeY family selenium metabolism-linked hydrolase [bacterium]HQH80079.1 YgeY family selenium metabolism-linked hydrolase [bacterium]
MSNISMQIARLAESLSTSIANFLADIVSIPSLSGDEKRVVERIGHEMKAVGFDEVRVDGLGSVIGRIGSGKKIIAMDAHIDTVDVGTRELWDFDPFDGHVKGGKVWGRGAADQKGGIASLVYAGKIIKELGLEDDYTLLVTGTVMEEDCDGLCWDYLIREENVRPDLCLITEPTGLRIYRGHRGRMEMKVNVKGLSSHGSAPERGDNAIYKMAPLVLDIEKLNAELQPDTENFLGKGTVVVSDISSVSPSLCAVADGCSIHLDRRLTAGETKDIAVGQILNIVGRAGGKVSIPVYDKPGYTGKSHPMESYFPTWVTPKDHPAVRAAVSSYEGLFNSKPVVDKWTFSTNGVTVMGVHGIPCVGFGPGFEEQAHAPNEWTPVEHLWKAAAFYAQYPKSYLSL